MVLSTDNILISKILLDGCRWAILNYKMVILEIVTSFVYHFLRL